MDTAKTGRLRRAAGRWAKPAALVLVYLLLLALHWRIQPYADDLWYAEEAAGWNFFALQGHYYLTWSGRVLSSALAFLLMGDLFWLWRLLNPLVLMALAWGLARLAVPRPRFRGFFMALALLFVLGPGVADYSIFWATGSLYYLWPTAAAAFLLHPYADLARALGPLKGLPAPGAAPPLTRLPLRLALAVPACLGNELLTLCVLGFMAVILADYALREKRLPRHYLWPLLAALGCAAVLFLAPGSRSRFAHESRLYRDEFGPLFTSLPLGEKLSGGLAWMFDMVFAALFPLLMVLFALAWLRRYRPGLPSARQRPVPGAALTPGATPAPNTAFALLREPRWPGLALFAVFGFSAALAFPARADAMFTFAPLAEAAEQGAGALLAALLPYGYWALFLAALLALLARWNRYAALGLVAGLCTMAAMIFSPTIYFSGERTAFTAGILLIAVILAAFKNKITALPMIAIGCLAATSLMRLVSRLALFYG